MKLYYQLGYKYFSMPWDRGPRDELLQLIESGRITPCRAIDLGCGTGSNAVLLAQYGFDVTGVDFAASAIDKAKQKGTGKCIVLDPFMGSGTVAVVATELGRDWIGIDLGGKDGEYKKMALERLQGTTIGLF